MCCNACAVKNTDFFVDYDRRRIVEDTICYMEKNYMKDISLNKISKDVYLNPIYFSKIFKQQTGDSPINYLIRIRLNKARNLIDRGELAVKEIAKMVGYDDPYYFSKLFKKYYGCSPSKYKRKL